MVKKFLFLFGLLSFTLLFFACNSPTASTDDDADGGTTTVAVTGITLNKSATTLAVGGTETLVATVAPTTATTKTVTWASSNTSAATVSAAGVVTGVVEGTSTITVTTTDGSFTATCTITVVIPVTGVSLNKSITTILTGNTETLIATIAPNDATNQTVSWSSNNAGVATVNTTTGEVTADSTTTGTATITATTAEGGFTATCTVTVTNIAVVVTGVSLAPATATIDAGDTVTLTATIAPAGATNQNVTWSSSDNGIATVAGGVVTGVADGTATITVTTTDGSFTDTSDVTVNVPVTGVTLNKATETFEIGDTETLIATVAPSGASNTTVTWTSSDPAVASVGSSTGLITALTMGTTTITTTTQDGSFTDTCEVEVVILATSITMYDNNANALGATLALEEAQIQYIFVDVQPGSVSDNTYEFSSTNASVAIAENYQGNDRIVGVGIGTATITVTSNSDDSVVDTVAVTVTADTTAPATDGAVYFSDTTTLLISFDEIIDETSAETISNYTLTGYSTTIVSATLDAAGTIVTLIVDTAFTVGDSCSIEIANITDLASNPMVTETVSGTYNVPPAALDPAEIVIASGVISGNAGAAASGSWATWDSDNDPVTPDEFDSTQMVFILLEGAELSQANVLGSSNVENDGSFSAINGGATFASGNYDLMIMDQKNTTFSSRITITVP